MLDSVKKLGPSGAIGLLLGFGLVIWIDPTTNAGAGLIIILTTAIVTVVGASISAVRSRKRDASPNPESDGEP